MGCMFFASCSNRYQSWFADINPPATVELSATITPATFSQGKQSREQAISSRVFEQS
jgi:hypothetical protein